MIVEIETSFSDKYKNYIVESLEVPIDDNIDPHNVEAVIADAAIEWFYKTAEEFFKKVSENNYDKYLAETFFDYK